MGSEASPKPESGLWKDYLCVTSGLALYGGCDLTCRLARVDVELLLRLKRTQSPTYELTSYSSSRKFRR